MLASLIVMWGLSLSCSSAKPLPILAQVPTLPGRSVYANRVAPSAQVALRGHVRVVNFFFTTCPTTCPVLMKKMSSLQNNPRLSALDFASVTVDPLTDSVSALERYAKTIGADASRWEFVNLAPKDLLELVHVFRTSDGGGPEWGHSRNLYLVDARGRVRGVYASDDPRLLEKLIRDDERLVKENGSV